MAGERVDAIARGALSEDALEPHERAIQELVRKSVKAPARLEPGDLTPLLRTLGRSGMVEVVAMLCAFHFINRIADLAGIRSDIPAVRSSRSRWWSVGVRVQGRLMRALIDLRNRTPEYRDPNETLAALARVRGIPIPPGYAVMAESPGATAWLATCLESWTGLDPAMLSVIGRAVAEALPASPEDVTGFHARPEDPLEALAFVGTRYPARTSDALVAAVRRARGCDDGELTDIFYTIAMCNCWERLDRLLAHVPE